MNHGHASLQHALENVAHLLPAQGPIGVFIHHNTLHTFQHLTFEAAVVDAAKRFGNEPYFTEERYQTERARGRIRISDIQAVLERESDAQILARQVTRRQLRLAMLAPGVRRLAPENIEWLIDEQHLLDRLHPGLDARLRARLIGRGTERTAARSLFAACFRRVPPSSPPPPARPARPCDGLEWTGVDLDSVVHPWLIRLSSVFLDQGLAYWPMPQRELGFYRAVRDSLAQRLIVEPEYLAGLAIEFRTQKKLGLTAEEVVERQLAALAIDVSEYESFLGAELLALPGWAGLIRRLEEDPALFPHDPVPCSLMDFVAVRLTFTAIAARNVWTGHSSRPWYAQAWRETRPSVQNPNGLHLSEVAQVFETAQLLGLTAEEVNSLSSAEFTRLHDEVRQFGEIERRRVLHLAYEWRHEQEILGPLMQHRREAGLAPMPTRPSAQVMFCIDEREESIRRALEEIDASVETLSAAGFYGVAVNYRGLDDAHGAALCPVVVKPKHAVHERPVAEDTQLHAERQERRRLWSRLAHTGFVGSRTLVRGWVGTIGFGLLSLFPLITRVLAPRQTGRLVAWLSGLFLPAPRTELTLMRHDAVGHHAAEGQLVGFSIAEKAERVASVLRPAGMTANLSRLVIVLGHGSTSLNNPHESAHDCGACGGRRGGPNARLFAAMANHPQVRRQLGSMGISIPEDTWFVGGYHDTCSDHIEYFDDEQVPASHRHDYARIVASLDKARAWNARERCRRFEAAWSAETSEQALHHVEERSEHLAEPRPEYGHCTNAVAVVGRRSLTRNLFLDRRAFLISYDPLQDPDDTLLAQLLAAGGPVCAGINLEYYFSVVDNEGYGAGTKLPHNVTGLVGVMNGHASDLRTGLPWQMVEIHEPVRLLLVLETTPQRALNAVGKNGLVTELVANRWIRVATIDPVDGQVHVYRDGVFEPFAPAAEPLAVVTSSADWYQGRAEHLPIARISPRKIHS